MSLTALKWSTSANDDADGHSLAAATKQLALQQVHDSLAIEQRSQNIVIRCLPHALTGSIRAVQQGRTSRVKIQKPLCSSMQTEPTRQ